jgi:hypothetical protein
VSETLPEGLVALMREASPYFISTAMPDGSPQLTQTWVDPDGAHILINTVEGFQKVKNVRRDPRVAVAVSDPSNPPGIGFRHLQSRGPFVAAPSPTGSSVSIALFTACAKSKREMCSRDRTPDGPSQPSALQASFRRAAPSDRARPARRNETESPDGADLRSCDGSGVR